LKNNEDLKIGRKWVKYKTNAGWKKVWAPLYDKEFKLSLIAMKYLLKELYGFTNVEEIEGKIIPYDAQEDGIRDSKAALPTKILIVTPPITSIYPELKEAALRSRYVGRGLFANLTVTMAEKERETLEKLALDIQQLFPHIQRYAQLGNLPGAQKVFRKYYRLPELEVLKKEPEIVEKVEVKVPEEKKTEEEKIREKEIPILKPGPEPGITEEEISEPEPELELEIPAYREQMERDVADYLEKEFNSKDFLGQVTPKNTFEIIRNQAKGETIRREATRIFHCYIQRGCK